MGRAIVNRDNKYLRADLSFTTNLEEAIQFVDYDEARSFLENNRLEITDFEIIDNEKP